jgi:hypothetical protein
VLAVAVLAVAVLAVAVLAVAVLAVAGVRNRGRSKTGEANGSLPGRRHCQGAPAPGQKNKPGPDRPPRRLGPASHPFDPLPSDQREVVRHLLPRRRFTPSERQIPAHCRQMCRKSSFRYVPDLRKRITSV